MPIRFQLNKSDSNNPHHMSLVISGFTEHDATAFMSVFESAKIRYVFDEYDKCISVEGGSQILNVMDCLSSLPGPVKEKIDKNVSDEMYYAIKANIGAFIPTNNEMLSHVANYLPPSAIYNLARTCHFFWKNRELKREFSRKVSAKLLSVGYNRTFILYNDGSVYACGVNDKGQLGLGHSNLVNIPMKLTALEGKNVRDIISHCDFTFFLCDDGVYTCGNNKLEQPGSEDANVVQLPTKVEALAGETIINWVASNESYFFICNDGVYVCGSNSDGKLGLGHSDDVYVPIRVTALDGKRVREVISRECSTYYICDDGIYVCGLNNVGQLGLGDNLTVNVATKLSALEDKIILNFVTGIKSAFFICKDGVYACGSNTSGQLGLEHNNVVHTPTKVTALKGKVVRNVNTTNHGNTYFTCDDGVYACGFNSAGELGLGHTNVVLKPTKIPTLERGFLRQIVDGYYATYFICSNGIYVCGLNKDGELGLGHGNAVYTPTKLISLENKTVRKILTGNFPTFFICDDGIYGPDMTNLRLSLMNRCALFIPREFTNLRNKKIQNIIEHAGSFYFIGDNSLYVCGPNKSGELGLGHTDPVDVPTRMLNPLRRDIVNETSPSHTMKG